MKIAVLGSGMVGRGHAQRLRSLGHDVTVGTRNPEAADAVDGTPTTSYEEAVRQADLVVNAVNGTVAVEVLHGLADALARRVVVDVTNPLDFASGQLRLFVCNTDSLAEQIQRAIPDARVVKTCNMLNVAVQVEPASVGFGDHAMFVAGNDATAKAMVASLLREYGWTTILDLGDLTAARAMEMMLPVWLRLSHVLGTDRFGYRLVTGQ